MPLQYRRDRPTPTTHPTAINTEDRKAKPTANAPQSPAEEAEANYKRGNELFQQGTAESLQAAIPYFEKAATLYEQIGVKVGPATASLLLGRIYSDLGEFQKALNYYDQALPISRAVADSHS
ncbi:MAG: tetratricopeptide repeat protein [Microcoleaceae cyanobacterium]